MWSRLPSLSADTDLLFSPTLNMQAQKAFDSPRRQKRGTGADLDRRLYGLGWHTASPPKRKPIVTSLDETYKAGIEAPSALKAMAPYLSFRSIAEKSASLIFFAGDPAAPTHQSAIDKP